LLPLIKKNDYLLREGSMILSKIVPIVATYQEKMIVNEG
jgi:hypothetical protein